MGCVVWKLLPIAAAALLSLSASPSAQTSHTTALPPVSYTCPMDPDVVEDHAGTCPRCKMTLVPVRLDTAYSCPLHPAVIETKAGACRICRRPLVAITVSLFWTCAGRADVHEMGPGTCADGSPRLAVRERRAHGDHNPRHGGQFFMASDNWHHVEGTLPRAGLFRLFVYDDFTRPIPLRGVSARVAESNTGAAAQTNEADVRAIRLTPAANGRYLEARVPAALPASLTATVRFGVNGAEQRFDFVFQTYTHEPAPGASAANPTPAAPLPAARPAGTTETVDSLIAALRANDRQLQTLLQQSSLAQLYLPALAAKDAALALESQAGPLPPARRATADAALKRLVLAAWSIDRYGDLGDRAQLDVACRAFSEAIAALVGVYGAP